MELPQEINPRIWVFRVCVSGVICCYLPELDIFRYTLISAQKYCG